MVCLTNMYPNPLKLNPNAKIIVIEKTMLPQGASMKIAGFASFGTVSEILEDI